jgi:hypothetical protein
MVRKRKSSLWAALVLAGAGAALLLWMLVGLLRAESLLRASSRTAGGAATLRERCSRSVPPDLAQACIAEGQAQVAAAERPLWGGAFAGVALLVAAALLRRRQVRLEHDKRRQG